MEAQVERFAPGFRDRILARHVLGPADLQERNAQPGRRRRRRRHLPARPGGLPSGPVAVAVPDAAARPVPRLARRSRAARSTACPATPPPTPRWRTRARGGARSARRGRAAEQLRPARPLRSRWKSSADHDQAADVLRSRSPPEGRRSAARQEVDRTSWHVAVTASRWAWGPSRGPGAPSRAPAKLPPVRAGARRPRDARCLGRCPRAARIAPSPRPRRSRRPRPPPARAARARRTRSSASCAAPGCSRCSCCTSCASEPSYGNQLMERVGELSGGALAVNPNTMYPLLRSLEAQGLVAGEWEHPERRSRRFYRAHRRRARPSATRLAAELGAAAGRRRRRASTSSAASCASEWAGSRASIDVAGPRQRGRGALVRHDAAGRPSSTASRTSRAWRATGRAAGARVLWDSPPGGRGRVLERVTRLRGARGPDARRRGRADPRHPARRASRRTEDGVTVTLELEYELKEQRPGMRARRPALRPPRRSASRSQRTLRALRASRGGS